MLSQSAGGKATDAAENRIGSLDPYKGLGLWVVNSHEVRDRGFQFAHAVGGFVSPLSPWF